MRPANWHKINEKVAVASIQKCASTSMVALLGESVPPSKVIDCDSRVVFFRHPTARLISAYNSLMKEDYLPKEVTNWDSFIDYTLEHEDVHWEPQTNLLTYNGEFFPTIVEQFENLERRWDCYVDKPLTWMNRTLSAGRSRHREDELSEKYREDSYFWAVGAQ